MLADILMIFSRRVNLKLVHRRFNFVCNVFVEFVYPFLTNSVIIICYAVNLYEQELNK